jgi:hypothetical protein
MGARVVTCPPTLTPGGVNSTCDHGSTIFRSGVTVPAGRLQFAAEGAALVAFLVGVELALPYDIAVSGSGPGFRPPALKTEPPEQGVPK